MAKFDSIADHYEAFCHTELGAFVDAVERELIMELLDPQPHERIIDLGCGTGAYAVLIASAGCEVVGIDESEAMLVQAVRKPVTEGHIECHRADITNLSWPSNSFDAGLMQVTLEFVSDPKTALTEAVRVVKPKGRLILGLIYGTGPWAQHYRVRALADVTSVYRNARFWTIREMNSIMGAEPSSIRSGLYVSPHEFITTEQAWDLEYRYRTTRRLDDAGFVVLRYDLETID